MPNITMCKGINCPKKNEYYRFLATPSKYMQSFFMEVPFKDNKCDEFWNARPKKE